MHVVLVPIGSHGDVHPFVGLGHALLERGHQVTVVTNPHFEPLVRQLGLNFLPLGTEEQFRQAIDNPDLWEPMRGFRLVMSMLGELVRPLYDILVELTRAGDVVIAAQVTAWGARVAQDAIGVPVVTIHLQPSVMLSAIDPPRVPLYALIKPLPVWARQRVIDAAQRYMIDPLIAPAVNRVRSEVGLAPVRMVTKWWHSPQRVLGLFPDWFAPPAPDWPAQLTLTGFPLFDERDHVEPDPVLERFLAQGDPPIVFTAGSANRHGADFFRAAVEACTLLGRRGLLVARFAEQMPPDLPAHVSHVSYVPFSHLLPRAAAIVHHGGIGTTGQALAAGIPQLVTPLAHDQPDNAFRLEKLGVGRALPPDRVRGSSLAHELGTLLGDPKLMARARALAERIDRNATVEASCRVIEEVGESRLTRAV